MKKLFFFSSLVCALNFFSFGQEYRSNSDCTKDIKDHRGKMKPWKKGAHETSKYRNVFLDAGYKQADIDVKLTKAYQYLFEGPNRVYFEVGDSMAYVSDLKNHDARTEGLSYGLMVAVQLDKKGGFRQALAMDKKIHATSGWRPRCLFRLECQQ